MLVRWIRVLITPDTLYVYVCLVPRLLLAALQGTVQTLWGLPRKMALPALTPAHMMSGVQGFSILVTLFMRPGLLPK